MRTMRFHVRGGFSAQYRTAFVCAAVRVALFSDPMDLTSLNSAAYAALVSGKGPAEANCDALGIRNGFTFRTQPAGSLPKAGGTGRHCPGSMPVGKPGAPKRPSFVRAAIIAAAAASPTGTPVTRFNSGIP